MLSNLYNTTTLRDEQNNAVFDTIVVPDCMHNIYLANDKLR